MMFSLCETRTKAASGTQVGLEVGLILHPGVSFLFGIPRITLSQLTWTGEWYPECDCFPLYVQTSGFQGPC